MVLYSRQICEAVDAYINMLSMSGSVASAQLIEAHLLRLSPSAYVESVADAGDLMELR